MSEGRDRGLWRHTSAMLATMLNCHRTKGAAVRPEQLNPYASAAARRRGRRITADNIEDMYSLVPAKGGARRKSQPRPAGEGRNGHGRKDSREGEVERKIDPEKRRHSEARRKGRAAR